MAKTKAFKESTNESMRTGMKNLPDVPNAPKELLEIAAIIKYNAAIRRFCALNIIQHLVEIGTVKKEDKCYVNFVWTKFQVNAGDVIYVYKYTEIFFFKALIKSFSDFASHGGKVISDFCDISKINIDNIYDDDTPKEVIEEED